LLTSNGRVQ